MKDSFDPFDQEEKEQPIEEKTSKSNGRFSNMAQRLGLFFSHEPQKEKVLRQEDFHAAGDVYYASVSAGYKVIQRFLWVVFVCFMAISVILNYKDITYDNFFYLFRDFSSAVDAESTTYETLSYESSPGQQFALYRGGIAVVSPSGISAFTATGRRTLRAESGFSAPFVVCSDRYMLVYDTAGNTFSVYNSFARVYTEKLEYPITDACFGDDGSFAIVTREASRRTVVHIYDKDFNRDTFRGDSYMFDIAMDTSANRVAFVYYGAGNGTGQTQISIRERSTLEEIDRVSLDGEFPLSCGFMENHRFSLITDSAIRVFQADFNEDTVEMYDYSGTNITGFCVTKQGVAVSVIRSSQNEVIAFDKNGKMLYNGTVQDSVIDIAVFGEYLFLQTNEGVIRLHSASGNEEFLVSGNGRLLLYSEDTALVCGESKAEYLVFEP